MLTRLASLVPMVVTATAGLSPARLTTRSDGKWSIQEHVGHLLDLDGLHIGRLDDFEAGLPILRAADLANRRTWEAGHNRRPWASLLAELEAERGRFVQRLSAYGKDFWQRSAQHPRLQQPMRVIDLADFVVEHDAHHLGWIRELRAPLAGR